MNEENPSPLSTVTMTSPTKGMAGKRKMSSTFMVTDVSVGRAAQFVHEVEIKVAANQARSPKEKLQQVATSFISKIAETKEMEEFLVSFGSLRQVLGLDNKAFRPIFVSWDC